MKFVAKKCGVHEGSRKGAMAAAVLSVSLVVLAYPAMAQERLSEGLRIVRACAGDVERLCAGIVPGGGRIKACVKENLTQLSPQCFDAIVGAIAAHKEPPPDYAATAHITQFSNVRGVRYCELFFIGAELATESLYANFFNTTDLNNADPRDTCPAPMWAKVEAEALAKQHGVLSVFKNDPRGWTMDAFSNPAGDVQTFDGLEARWFGRVELPKNFGKQGATFYKPTTVHRTTVMRFEKGKLVFILDDPEGTPAVMQAFSTIVDPDLTYDGLKNLGAKLKLAEGWKFRVKVLDTDLEIHTISGKARVVQDDLENSYDVCFEEAGQQACSIKP